MATTNALTTTITSSCPIGRRSRSTSPAGPSTIHPRRGSTWSSLAAARVDPRVPLLPRALRTGGKPGCRRSRPPTRRASHEPRALRRQGTAARPNALESPTSSATGRPTSRGPGLPARTRQPQSLYARHGCTDTNNNAADLTVKTAGCRTTAPIGTLLRVAPVLAPIGKQTADRETHLVQRLRDRCRPRATHLLRCAASGRRDVQAETRTFDWTPGADQAGSHKVTFKVTDGYRTDCEACDLRVRRCVVGPGVEHHARCPRQTKRLVATGEVEPSSPDGSVVVRLLRFANGGYGASRSSARRSVLEYDSVSFRVQRPGGASSSRYSGVTPRQSVHGRGKRALLIELRRDRAQRLRSMREHVLLVGPQLGHRAVLTVGDEDAGRSRTRRRRAARCRSLPSRTSLRR